MEERKKERKVRGVEQQADMESSWQALLISSSIMTVICNRADPGIVQLLLG